MLPLIMAGAQAGMSIANILQARKAKKGASKAYKQYMAEVNKIYAAEKLRYQPGGAFEKKELQDIAEARTSTTGAAMNRLIASGMTGGETGLGVESVWEKSVGIPGRLTLEDLRSQRLSEIERERGSMLMGQAGQAMTLAGEAGAAQGQMMGSLFANAPQFLFGQDYKFPGLFPQASAQKTPAYQPGRIAKFTRQYQPELTSFLSPSTPW